MLCTNWESIVYDEMGQNPDFERIRKSAWRVFGPPRYRLLPGSTVTEANVGVSVKCSYNGHDNHHHHHTTFAFTLKCVSKDKPKSKDCNNSHFSYTNEKKSEMCVCVQPVWYKSNNKKASVYESGPFCGGGLWSWSESVEWRNKESAEQTKRCSRTGRVKEKNFWTKPEANRWTTNGCDQQTLERKGAEGKGVVYFFAINWCWTYVLHIKVIMLLFNDKTNAHLCARLKKFIQLNE